MSYAEAPGQTLTFAASADYSSATGLGSQYKIVVLGANAVCTVASAATTSPLGVLYNRPNTGEAGTVVTSGVAFVQVDSTTDIAVGDAIAANASGIGIKTTTATNYVLGRALEARTANTVGIIPVLLTLGAVVPGAAA